jgi:hypothetical protein
MFVEVRGEFYGDMGVFRLFGGNRAENILAYCPVYDI